VCRRAAVVRRCVVVLVDRQGSVVGRVSVGPRAAGRASARVVLVVVLVD